MAGIGGDASPMGESGIRDLLEAAVKDEGEKESVRKHAIEALGYLGTEASLDALSPLLSAGNPYAQDAAKAVGRIGQRVTEEQEITTKVELSKAGELLLDVFRSADTDELRLVAAAGLSLMGAQPVEALLEDLRGGSPELRPWIAAILGAIGKPATDAVLEARGAVQEAEGAGETLEEAKQAALEELGVPADQVEFEVVQRPHGAWFWRVGFRARAVVAGAPVHKAWCAATLKLIGDARALDFLERMPEEEQPAPEKVEAGREILDDLQAAL